jgi:hypothetical protein
MEKELFLRRLENKLGKGTAWSDEDEDNWDWGGNFLWDVQIAIKN